MKSKTKTIPIFAAILAAVFLIAFRRRRGAVCRRRGGRGAADRRCPEEDIDIAGDLANPGRGGKFVWKAGRLYMDTDEDWWRSKTAAAAFTGT